jgi:hypothetical protein
MNKIIPIVFVLVFWGLYYIGITYQGTGEAIAIIVTLIVLLYLLFSIKGWLKKKVNNINI